MTLDIIQKDYDRFNNNSQKAYYNWYAYVNDYRVFGGKMYDFGTPYETFELPDGAYDVEIWRTLRKKDTNYQILWGSRLTVIQWDDKRTCLIFRKSVLGKSGILRLT